MPINEAFLYALAFDDWLFPCMNKDPMIFGLFKSLKK